MTKRAQMLRVRLINILSNWGYPEEFGEMIADCLKSENAMSRMISYLYQYRPECAEDIADEMLAIRSDFDRWQEKKKTEYYNRKYNELLNEGLGQEDDI